MTEADLSRHIQGLFSDIADEASERSEDAPFRDRSLEMTALGLDDVLFLQENGRPDPEREWEAFLADSDWTYQAGPEGVSSAGEVWTEGMEAAVTAGELATGRGDHDAWLAIPIQVQDAIIGVLELSLDDPKREWSPEERGMIEAIAEQVAGALEAARLRATLDYPADSEE